MSDFKKIITNLKNKTFFLHSLGCRVNRAELLKIAAYLEKLGFSLNKNNPGLIIINTCSVTEKALLESKKEAKSLKKKYPQARILILGCGVESNPIEFSWADLALNNTDKEKLLNTPHLYSPHLNQPLAVSKRYLFRIQAGCNCFCAYCLVPFLRRKLIDLSSHQVIGQIKEIESLGFQEIILTGTNLALYGQGKNYCLSDLTEKILVQTKIPRISFGSVNLRAIDNKFIKLYQKDWQKGAGRLSRYLHIPLQSGSDFILKKMKRPYRVQEYKNIINKLVNNIPLMGIGADLIVGFPGEEKKDFQKTVNLVKRLPFSRLHIFRFNPRENTLAHLKEEEWGRVSEHEKQRRAKVLSAININRQKAFKAKLIGKKLPVLFLKKIGKKEWSGLADNYVTVKTKSPQNLRGKIKRIVIT